MQPATPRFFCIALFALATAENGRAQGLIEEFLGSSSSKQLGIAMAAAGDVDGDGHPDFMLGSLGAGSSIGRVHVYSGLDRSVIYVFQGQNDNDVFGSAVAGVGDVDLDGFDDLVVGAQGANAGNGPSSGTVTLLSGLDGATLHTWVGPAYSNFGATVAAAGDVDMDGWLDVAVGAPGQNNATGSEAGAVYVFSGKDYGTLYTFEGFHHDHFGTTVAGGGDANNDGHDDILVTSSPNASAPYLRLFSGKSGAVLRNTFGPLGSGFGLASAFVGDANADGWADYAIGAPDDSTVGAGAGAVILYNGRTGQVIRTTYGDSSKDHLGCSVSALGDVDLDGRDDLLVGARGENPRPGYARVIASGNGSTLRNYQGQAVGHGRTVAGVGDVDLDGALDLLVGDQAFKSYMGMGRVRLHSTGCTPGTTYCEAKVNSLGCTPSIGATGLPTLTGPDEFHVTAANVLNKKAGLMLWSREQAHSPFLGGTLCLATPIRRSQGQVAGGSPTGLDCSGTFDFHFDQAYMALVLLFPGETVHCQYWARDQGFSPPNNSSLSNGLVFTLCL